MRKIVDVGGEKTGFAVDDQLVNGRRVGETERREAERLRFGQRETKTLVSRRKRENIAL